MHAQSSERKVVFLVGAVQFVNILDFMMVMPLGPDFAPHLGIPLSQIGAVGGIYGAAAALSGVAGAFFLERFDRRSALSVAMLGLVVATVAGGFAQGLFSLLAARALAGLFGGPATSLAYAIVADTVPPERRGKAVGAMMGAFAASSVLGVPAGLELARLGGWRLPFFCVGAMGLAIALGAGWLLPSLRGHLAAGTPGLSLRSLKALLSKPVVWFSYSLTGVVMGSSFMLIPNLSPYLQSNLNYPRAKLGLLYMFGGAVSFLASRLVGMWVDRLGPFLTGTAGALLLVVVVVVGFGFPQPLLELPVMAVFIAFMLAMAFRNVSYNTLTSLVPAPAERARFMSIQSAVQHGASALGAFTGSRLLRELPDRRLSGMPRVAMTVAALTLLIPFLMYLVQVRARPRGLSLDSAVRTPEA
jgi:predicted MFS family arabinose efflux permease